MSILNKLRNVKREYFIQEHPLATKDISFRYSYAIGCGIMAAVDGEINGTEKTRMNELILSLRLIEDYTERIIGIVATIDEMMITEIVQSMSGKYEQYVFILDLYKMAQADGEINEEEQESIAIFSDLMQLSAKEQEFLRSFASAMETKDVQAAEEVLQDVYKEGLEISLEAYDILCRIYSLRIAGTYTEDFKGRQLELATGKSETTAVAPKEGIDVCAVYDKLEAEMNDILKKSQEAFIAGNFELGRALKAQWDEMRKVQEELGAKFTTTIFNPERTKALFSNARASIANRLHHAAD